MIPAIGATFLALQVGGGGWHEGPPLPRPVTENAVVAVTTADGAAVLSLLGRGAGEDGADVGVGAFRWDVGSGAWRELPPPPGPPRLGAAAEAVGGRVYLMGGYTVAADGSERSLDRVDVYDPEGGTWSAGAPLPVVSSEGVSGVWRDSLIYVVGGPREGAAQGQVHVYDPATDRWRAGTPIPGAPGSGHAGAVARDAIVYLGGGGTTGSTGTAGGASASPDTGDTGSPGAGTPAVGGEGRRPAMAGGAWRGDIDPGDPAHIAWRRLPDPPGPARFGASAAAVGTRVVFVGGSEFAGGREPAVEQEGALPAAAPPVRGALVYDLVTGGWSRTSGPPEPATNPRGLVRAGGWLVLAGGDTSGRGVSDRVWRVSVLEMVTGGS